MSAGVLLWRRAADGALEVLLGHPGGPYFTRRDDGAWSIPKGEIEDESGEADSGSVLLATARREFEEETGHPPPGGPELALGSIRQKGGKVVHAWAIEGDLDPVTARSNEFSLEWPPGSGRFESFPEIDRVEWFGLPEARVRIKETQVPLIDRLEAVVDAAAEGRETGDPRGA